MDNFPMCYCKRAFWLYNVRNASVWAKQSHMPTENPSNKLSELSGDTVSKEVIKALGSEQE